MKLKNKTALVIGGGTGIGWGIAKAFAEEGAHVGIAGRRLEVLTKAAQQVQGPTSMVCHVVDVADRQSVNQLIEWMTEELGRIDILVNSAGVNIPNRAMSQTTPADWDRLIAINATGAYNCMHAVLPQMRQRKDGLIINISSVAGKRAAALGGVAYSASKFAMAALGTAVSNELGAEGIRVTTIFPGEVDTPILEHRPTPVTAEHRARILKPEDFADLAVAIAALPPRAHVAELIVKPTWQAYV
jgi:NADP-dependent 3-hydroxy acid dehydrogenase YdfG